MPNNLQAWVGTASAAEVGKMQYSCFFPLCSEKSCHMFLLFPRITMSRPLPWELLLHLVLPLYIINSLEVEGAGVSPSKHPAYLAPALCLFVLLSVVFFGISCHPQLRFLGQACAGHEIKAQRTSFGHGSSGGAPAWQVWGFVFKTTGSQQTNKQTNTQKALESKWVSSWHLFSGHSTGANLIASREEIHRQQLAWCLVHC
jgi:hypothetical protein